MFRFRPRFKYSFVFNVHEDSGRVPCRSGSLTVPLNVFPPIHPRHHYKKQGVGLQRSAHATGVEEDKKERARKGRRGSMKREPGEEQEDLSDAFLAMTVTMTVPRRFLLRISAAIAWHET